MLESLANAGSPKKRRAELELRAFISSTDLDLERRQSYSSCLDGLHLLAWSSRDYRICFLWRLAGSHEGLPNSLSWMPTSFP